MRHSILLPKREVICYMRKEIGNERNRKRKKVQKEREKETNKLCALSLPLCLSPALHWAHIGFCFLYCSQILCHTPNLDSKFYYYYPYYYNTSSHNLFFTRLVMIICSPFSIFSFLKFFCCFLFLLLRLDINLNKMLEIL